MVKVKLVKSAFKVSVRHIVSPKRTRPKNVIIKL